MDDKKYLTLAADLAKQSKEPIGCGSVMINESGEVIASNFNSQRVDNLVASHAEMKSIAEANAKIGRKLRGLTAYSNCEPCTMCLTALIFADVDRIVFIHRLNDMVDLDKRIDIDCFDFVEKFPSPPKIEQIKL